MKKSGETKLTPAQRNYLSAIAECGDEGLWDGRVYTGPAKLCVERLIKRGLCAHRRKGFSGQYYFATDAGRAALAKGGA